MREIELREEDVASEIASMLIRCLDEDLTRRYPSEPINDIDIVEFKTTGGVFVVASVDEKAVGCGAFRPLSPSTAEIKRMFVLPQFRGWRISKHILHFLEQLARSRGFTYVRLETGNQQPEAIGLYRSSGYTEIPPFGQYVGSPVSVCFEKLL